MMKKLFPLVAVLALVAGILGCPSQSGDNGEEVSSGLVPSANAAMLEMAAQQADTHSVIATWEPVVFLNDTVTSFVRQMGRNNGSWQTTDTISAVGSESFSAPSPPAGSTATYFYCLKSRATNETGQLVTTPDSLQSCNSWQYTTPTSFPPAPDSLQVDPNIALAFDSIVTSPKLIQARPLRNPMGVAWPDSDMVVARGGFHMDVIGKPDSTWNDSATVWRRKFASGRVIYDTTPDNRLEDFATARIFDGGQVVGCLGYCDTVAISAATWDRGAPVYIAGRPGYGLDEYTAVRLPWFRQLDAS